jgi:hypothetical protein
MQNSCKHNGAVLRLSLLQWGAGPIMTAGEARSQSCTSNVNDEHMMVLIIAAPSGGVQNCTYLWPRTLHSANTPAETPDPCMQGCTCMQRCHHPHACMHVAAWPAATPT